MLQLPPMVYKTGTWGEKAKERSKKRNAYFNEYRKKREVAKVKARSAVYCAIKKGTIKPEGCNMFSNECRGRTEAHHNDYNKPLEIVWLCCFHHKQHHRENKKCVNS
jgi:hypothetical protein